MTRGKGQWSHPGAMNNSNVLNNTAIVGNGGRLTLIPAVCK